jgi:hypothetical protein
MPWKPSHPLLDTFGCPHSDSVLAHILRSLNELPKEPYVRKMTDKQHFPWHLPHPIDSLSLVNKKMRNVSLTSVYEKSIVRKDLSNVVSSLERKMTRRIFLVDVLKRIQVEQGKKLIGAHLFIVKKSLDLSVRLERKTN